jgi:hypothetical protein
MSRILKDKEMTYFLTELQHTPEGVRYRKAWDMRQRALKNIYGAATEADRDIARRQYIANADQATLALGVVTKVHGWPKDAQFEPSFTYRRPRAIQARNRAKGAPPI